MKELLDKLQQDAGLDAAQAAQALNVVKDFVKQKFPMFADAVDKLFEAEGVDGNEDFLE